VLSLEKETKGANVQRKILEDLQKSWRTVAHDHFKSYKIRYDNPFLAARTVR